MGIGPRPVDRTRVTMAECVHCSRVESSYATVDVAGLAERVREVGDVSVVSSGNQEQWSGGRPGEREREKA